MEAGKALLKEGRKEVVVAEEEAVGVALPRKVPRSDLIKEEGAVGLKEGEGVDEGSPAPDDVT